uniref:hypothetical protein n=1 Tax=Escherichia coli TaxID=562 RepID=UPI001CA70652
RPWPNRFALRAAERGVVSSISGDGTFSSGFFLCPLLVFIFYNVISVTEYVSGAVVDPGIKHFRVKKIST